MDFYSKKLIGWSYEIHRTVEITLKSIQNACLKGSSIEKIILDSDFDSQYTSDLFERYLSKVKIKHSFNRKRCPYDNAYIESFHSLLKRRRFIFERTVILKMFMIVSLNM